MCSSTYEEPDPELLGLLLPFQAWHHGPRPRRSGLGRPGPPVANYLEDTQLARTHMLQVFDLLGDSDDIRGAIESLEGVPGRFKEDLVRPRLRELCRERRRQPPLPTVIR